MATTNTPWLPKPPEDMVLTNARIVKPGLGTTTSPRSIWLQDGKIKKIVKGEEIQPGCPRINLGGKFLCPGLIDCHVHITATPGASSVRSVWDEHPDTLAYRTAWTAKQMLLRGFTTVRDCAGANSALREAINDGLVQGPRLFIAGKALSQTGGHGDLRLQYEGDEVKCCSGHGPGFARICDGVPACLEAARDELRRGADFLKIMVGGGVASPVDPLDMLQFNPEEIQAITRCARNLGKYVTAHAYTNEAIRLAVDNGVTNIEHGTFIDKATAEYCADKGVTVTPTLVTYQAMISPPYENFLPESGREKSKKVIASSIESLKILRDAGVTMCYGTDLLAGMQFGQNEEFRIRKQVLSDETILRSATAYAAKLLRMVGKIGAIKEGAFADLLVLDADPLHDVTVLADIDKHCFAIIKEGRVVTSRLEKEGLSVDRLYR